MKFDIIDTQEHSHADFSALLAFSSPEHAKESTKAINDSQWANSQSLTLGQSGAFQVGSHVMFNTYGEKAYGEIIDMLKKLPVPETEHEIYELYSSMWNSLADPDAPYSEARDLAILFFTKVLPGATVEALEGPKGHMFAITYRNKKFRAALCWDAPEGPRLKFVPEGNNSSDQDFTIYEGNEDIRKIFDDFIEGAKSSRTTPAKAMFALLATTDTSRPLAKATRKKIHGIANLFFQSYLPEATFSDCCVDYSSDCSGNSHECEWVEVWFGYKGREYHVDFVSTIDSDYINLWSTDKDCNLDVAKVTPESLANTISTMDRDGYFPETHKETPEEKIFNLINNTTMPDSVFVSAGKEFLAEYLPEATFCSFNTDRHAEESWYALWFKVNESDFRLDFNLHSDNTRGYELHEVYEDGDMGSDLPANPKTLRETIAKEPPKKSLEDRVARLETLVGQIQEEIKTIKKHI